MRLRLFLPCLFWGMATFTFAFPGGFDEQPYQNYIEEHLELARLISTQTGIPVSICLAQALHESAAGSSTLAMQANNHFGIKALDAKKWPGECFFIEDDDRDQAGNLKKSPFRKYGSVEACYQDYGNFLRGNTRYAKLFKIPATDFKAWAIGLQEAGYATDSLYADHIIEKIERFQLYDFDETPAPETSKLRAQTTDIQLVATYKPAKKQQVNLPDSAKTQKPQSGRQLTDAEKNRQPQNRRTSNIEAPFRPKEVELDRFTAPACPEPEPKLAPMKAKPVHHTVDLKF